MKILELGFENMLSYRDKTAINFQEPGVTVVTGPNGAGKSSIPTILEELLYNKNSHGLTKQEIPHRYSESQHYSGYVVFVQDNDTYKVVKTVKSTQKLQLFKNGEDVSSHTATQTYQSIEQIIGLDFNTFSKLVNQSMDSSLDFLSATDQKRKEFLVSLQNLERYYEVEEAIKADKKKVDAQLAQASARVTTQRKWLQSLDIPPIMDLVPEPTTQEIDLWNAEIQQCRQEMGEIKTQLNYADSNNQRISAHKQKVASAVAQVNRAKQNAIQKFIDCAQPPETSQLPKITYDLGQLSSRMSDIKQKHAKLKAEAQVTQCPTCKSSLDRSQTVKLANELAQEYKLLKTEAEQLQESKQFLETYEQYQKAQEEVERTTEVLNQLESEDVGTPIDVAALQEAYKKLEAQIKTLEANISQRNKEVSQARRANDEIKASNAARESKLEQAKQYKTDLEESEHVESELSQKSQDLGLLQKSTKDLVGYKIESNIKVFESLINHNLQELSDGQFGIGFELDKTKLGVVVFDHGTRVSLKALSSGEKSLVHVATLLAIRDTMVHSYGEDLNLLFLDEVISVLDPEKKDVLVSLLLKITNMSIFLVSHGYSNQLTKSLLVEKHPEGYSTIVQES